MKPFLITIKEGGFHIPSLRNLGEQWKQQAKDLSEQPNVKNFVREINQTTLEVKQLPIVIGRKEDAANVITSSAFRDVSRTHAEIFEENGEIKIRDLTSKQGTLLLREGQKPTKLTSRGTKLENNDTIQLGKYVQLQVLFEKQGFISTIKSWFSS
ncbi:FHA domain-containing protein [Candidatus Woesearchaeota archaeon]|nr:FHA domain-containing protein [Candidatus Woesearchaeota archaeon]